MWTASIESKTFSKGDLQVGVQFTDGTEVFSEPYHIGSLDDLNHLVLSRLNRLNTFADIDIPLGPYTPIEVEVDPEFAAMSKLRSVKELVELGVLEKTDPQVTEAIKEVKDTL